MAYRELFENPDLSSFLDLRGGLLSRAGQSRPEQVPIRKRLMRSIPFNHRGERNLADKLRVGIIGCGEICHHHTYGYLNSARYEVVALADLEQTGNARLRR